MNLGNFLLGKLLSKVDSAWATYPSVAPMTLGLCNQPAGWTARLASKPRPRPTHSCETRNPKLCSAPRRVRGGA